MAVIIQADWRNRSTTEYRLIPAADVDRVFLVPGWAPGQLADWTNTTNDAVKQAPENNQLARSVPDKMNEMVDLFNSRRQFEFCTYNSLGGLQDAENYFSNVSDRLSVITAMNRTADKA